MKPSVYHREGTTILDEFGAIAYEADCFESEQEAETAVKLMNLMPDIEWEPMARIMGIKLTHD